MKNINVNELKQFVETHPKLVTRKASTRYPGLYVLKYTRKVFYDALWSQYPMLEQCRGLVVDEDYNIVVRPFDKIYNYRENGAGSTWLDTDIVLVTKKVNGFMAAVSLYKNQVIISTTGSLDSDFVGYAEKYLSGITPAMIEENHTYLFEICNPDDPHIIPEKEGAHFLAVVDFTGLHMYKFDESISVIVENAIEDFSSIGIICDDDKELGLCIIEFGEVKKMVKDCRHEGFVIVHLDSQETIKIKSPYYLASKAIARKSDIMKVNKQFVDEEFYNLIDSIRSIKEEFNAFTEQQKLEYIRSYFDTEENGVI